MPFCKVEKRKKSQYKKKFRAELSAFLPHFVADPLTVLCSTKNLSVFIDTP